MVEQQGLSALDRRVDPVAVSDERAVGRWLLGFAVAVIVGMQAGTVFKPLGEVGDTRWADWVDLLTPYAVLGCAAAALWAARAATRAWLLLAVGGVLFTQGHGVHLAANSVGNVAPSDIAHLWDEVVSHYLWYVGLALVVAALAMGLAAVPVRVGPVAVVAGVLTGVTLFDTYIEGGTPVLGFVAAGAFVAAGWRLRATGVGRLLLVVFGTTLLALAGWGAYWQGFPQFSELGWI